MTKIDFLRSLLSVYEIEKSDLIIKRNIRNDLLSEKNIVTFIIVSQNVLFLPTINLLKII